MQTLTIPDAELRKEACDPTSSFTIRAPAGSGKTELLIQRIIHLLAVVDHPKRILAITFTKKASEEMQHRLVQRLFHDDKDHPLHQRAHELGWPWNPGESPCRIMTIDAWIQSWLNHPHAIHPLPEWLYREAWGHWLSFHRHPTALKRLLNIFDNKMSDLSHWMIDALSKRSLWLFDAYSGTPWSESMLQRQQNRINSWQTELNTALDPFKDNLLSIMQTIKHPHLPSLWPDIGNNKQWQQMADWLLTQNGKLRQRWGEEQGFPKGHYLSEKKYLSDICSHFDDRTLQLWNYMLGSDCLQDPHLLDDLCLILKDVLASLHLCFERYHACDFTQYLLDAIREVTYQHEPQEIEHLLLDEAQDTSQVQIQLLEKLTLNWRNPLQTIFIVGDPMQSIYRFRDADVREFMRLLQKGFPHHSLKALTLSSNFRQAPYLVNTLNQLFHNLFPPISVLEEGAIPFTPSFPIQSISGQCDAWLWTNEDSSYNAKMYDASCLKTLQINHNDESIGVLVRSRMHAHHLIRNATSNNPINALELLDANSRPILADAIEALVLIVDPSDTGAWLHLLRSRWIGLSLHACTLLPKPITILAHLPLLQDASTTLDNNLRHALISYHSTTTTSSTPSTLTEHWLRWLKNLGLLGEMSSNEIAVLLKIQSHLDTWQPRFATFTRTYLLCLFQKERLSLDFNSPTTVMSMHKSKGLEFDHVYLPQFDRPSKRLSIPPIALASTFTQHGSQCLIWHKPHESSKHTPWFAQLTRMQAYYEDKRLLYVALTRARKTITLSAMTQKNWASHIPFWKEHSGIPFEEPVCENTSHMRIQHPDAILHDEPSLPLLSQDTPSTQIGTLVHLGLYRAWLKTPEVYLASLLSSKPHSESHWLTVYSLIHAVHRDILEQALTLLQEVLPHPLIKDILRKRPTFCHAEYSISNGTNLYRIDRIYMDQDVIWILDYKTSAPQEDTRAAYHIQLKQYANVIQHMFPNHRIHMAIVWLKPVSFDVIN